MVNIKELRIGNMVRLGKHDQVVFGLLNNQSSSPVTCIMLAGNAIWNYEREVNPIPLTPEILEKCGFDVEYTNGGFLCWLKGDFKLLDRRLPYPQFHHPEALILHLHQLQNLYYALTGQELEIKL